jgi:hypothetical protein
MSKSEQGEEWNYPDKDYYQQVSYSVSLIVLLFSSGLLASGLLLIHHDKSVQVHY